MIKKLNLLENFEKIKNNFENNIAISILIT